MSSIQKWVKKVQIGISCTNVDRKMRVKNKRYYLVNYSFMKPFSQNFEVFTQCFFVINPEFVRKGVQTGISCTNDKRKIKIKSKSNFEGKYSFKKLFSRNLKIPALLWRHHFKIGSKRLKFVHHVQLAVKILKPEKVKNIPSKSWYRSGFNPSATNRISLISSVSFLHRTKCVQIQYGKFLQQWRQN